MKNQSAYELLGCRFERLVVVEILPTFISLGGKLTRKLRCKCDCGGEITTRLDTLKSGQSKSCGCLGKQRLSEGRYRHGLHLHPLYKVWTSIKQRCYNNKYYEYHLYGGSGVEMCEEWLNNPSEFINWALANGWRKGLQIDKDIKAKELGVKPVLYSPSMCSLVTPRINTNNRSITIFIEYNGERLCLTDWSERTGIPKDRLDDRYRKGWGAEKTLDPTDFSLERRLTSKKNKVKS